MEIFTVYKAYKVKPVRDWRNIPFQTPKFEKMREYVNRVIYEEHTPVKVMAIFAKTSKFHETREALTTLFDFENIPNLDSDPDIDSEQKITVHIDGASWEELEEVSAFSTGVPRDYYDRHPLWD